LRETYPDEILVDPTGALYTPREYRDHAALWPAENAA
jgi:hypothetical protein